MSASVVQQELETIGHLFLRPRNREVLKPIKDHCQWSTLVGERNDARMSSISGEPLSMKPPEVSRVLRKQDSAERCRTFEVLGVSPPPPGFLAHGEAVEAMFAKQIHENSLHGVFVKVEPEAHALDMDERRSPCRRSASSSPSTRSRLAK